MNNQAVSIRPIRFSTHANVGWRTHSGYRFAAASNIAPVAAEELAQAVSSYAIAFLDAETPSLVALLGLVPQENAFVAPDGRWLNDYVPAILRSYPFKLLPTEAEQYALGYDEGSDMLTAPGEGEAFFEADGQPTAQIQKIMQFLIGINSGLRATARAGARLRSSDLLEPWPLKVKDGDREQAITGLLRVNEEALNALDEAAFAGLRQGGTLAVAYAQLLSMSNVAKLARLTQARAQHAAHVEKQQEEIKSMFVPDHVEDEIDWDAMLKDDES